jgi:long-subunit fatty acid transport protein
MKVFKRLVLVAISVISFNSGLFAQGGQTALPFLILNPDSRSGGMGESGGGLADNSSAIFWNPAGIAFLTGGEVNITHSNWLPMFNLDIFYEYLTFRQYMEELDGSITASLTYMNYGEFVRTNSAGDELGKFTAYDAAMTIGYATKLSSDWGLGVNFRLIHSNLSDKPTEEENGKGTATTVSFDVAAMWRPVSLILPFIGEDIGNRFSVGANISNIGPDVYYIDKDQSDPLPMNFRLGFAYKILDEDYNNLTYTLDFSKLMVRKAGTRDKFYKAMFTSWADEPLSTELRQVITSTGLEYVYGQPGDFLFALRAGIFYEDPSYGNRKFATLGAGIRYDVYGFDFSYITTDVFKGGENHPLSNTLRFSLLINWGDMIKSNKGLPRGI